MMSSYAFIKSIYFRSCNAYVTVAVTHYKGKLSGRNSDNISMMLCLYSQGLDKMVKTATVASAKH